MIIWRKRRRDNHWQSGNSSAKQDSFQQRKTNKKFFDQKIAGNLDQIARLALKAHRVLEAEFSGDLLLDQNHQTLIIEVNRAPQFRIFEKRTGINIAKEIIDYLIGKS